MFFYFPDPDGMTLEYRFGMKEFSETGARLPRRVARTVESSDPWGGMREPDFARIRAIEQMAPGG